ncbi:MAG: AmmeMemoRadiSam system protein B [Candidatus Omnitrophica bacterium]|nr:AmmeMemoRadiSam system protein B [Candidatus Omnitrophota bacterium]
MEQITRKAVVAGTFYPSTGNEIRKQIATFLSGNQKARHAIACMVPHAGYMYSGQVAAETLASITMTDTAILIGPNHTGYGKAYSIMSNGTWQTPLGDITIDTPVAKTLLTTSKYLEDDATAHAREHSLEVELPLLQYFKPDIKVIPITLMAEDTSNLKSIGIEIADAIRKMNRQNSILVVASSDMTHYESQESARAKDTLAIEAIVALDEDKLAATVRKSNISMCGWTAAVTMLAAAKALGARTAQLIRYQTSGDITKDTESVVGYAGITIS